MINDPIWEAYQSPSISEIWEKWKITNPELTDPTVVNNGYCADFLLDCMEVIQNIEPWIGMVSGGEHAFMKIGELFYDAEVLDGASDLRDLPIWQRCADLADTSIETFTNKCHATTLEHICQEFNFHYPPF